MHSGFEGRLFPVRKEVHVCRVQQINSYDNTHNNSSKNIIILRLEKPTKMRHRAVRWWQMSTRNVWFMFCRNCCRQPWSLHVTANIIKLEIRQVRPCAHQLLSGQTPILQALLRGPTKYKQYCSCSVSYIHLLMILHMWIFKNRVLFSALQYENSVFFLLFVKPVSLFSNWNSCHLGASTRGAWWAVRVLELAIFTWITYLNSWTRVIQSYSSTNNQQQAYKTTVFCNQDRDSEVATLSSGGKRICRRK